MRKLRASMEPFWDLKIHIYVEYLMHVSSEYITSRVLLSLTSTAGRTSHVLVANVIPWINKASLALYIARMLCAMPCRDQPNVALSSLSPVIENYQYQGRELVSDSTSAIDALISMWLRLCTHYWRPFTTILLWTIMQRSYWACGQFSY